MKRARSISSRSAAIPAANDTTKSDRKVIITGHDAVRATSNNAAHRAFKRVTRAVHRINTTNVGTTMNTDTDTNAPTKIPAI